MIMVKLTFSLVRLEGRVRLFTLLREKLVVSEAADQLATAVLGGVCAARSARVAPSSKGGGRWTDDRAYTRIIFGILHPPAPRSLSIGIASVVASLFCALSLSLLSSIPLFTCYSLRTTDNLLSFFASYSFSKYSRSAFFQLYSSSRLSLSVALHSPTLMQFEEGGFRTARFLLY